jgi:hypothetical protein
MSFFDNIKSFILNSSSVKNGYISFKFPNYTSQNLVGLPQMSSPAKFSQLIAASMSYEDAVLMEGIDKCEFALNAVKDKMKISNHTNFVDFINKNIRLVGKEMGLLFEIELFYTLTQNGLNPSGENEFLTFSVSDAIAQRRNLIQEIKTKSGINIDILKFVQFHARELAAKLIEKTKLILKCNPDTVIFTGGSADFNSRIDVADIKLGCKAKEIGYSTKFTSEKFIHVASVKPSSLYLLLNGPDLKIFLSNIEAYKINYKKTKKYVINEIYALLDTEKSPDKFAYLLNYFLTGKTKTFFAPVLYTHDIGGPDWANSIKKDFIFSEKSNKLIPKRNAEITLLKNQTYAKMNYKVEGGSTFGTSIIFEPEIGDIVRFKIKITNLVNK